jgi:hypothetical protein
MGTDVKIKKTPIDKGRLAFAETGFKKRPIKKGIINGFL